MLRNLWQRVKPVVRPLWSWAKPRERLLKVWYKVLGQWQLFGLALRPFVRPTWRKLMTNFAPRIAPDKTFCILAWKHLQINPEGTAKLCCRACGSVSDRDDRALSLDRYSLDEIWNSTHMQETRRKMVSGERVPECVGCYEAEAAGVTSYRTESNDKWLEKDGLTLAEGIARAKASLGKPQAPPVFYQLNLGNLCNLKCRMCSASYSSQIEADPVHSEWVPRIMANESGMARWSGEKLVVYPNRFHDVKEPKPLFVFTGSEGSAMTIPLGAADEVTSLELKLSPGAMNRPLRVRVNGVVCYEGTPAQGNWPETFDLAGRELGRQLDVRVEDGRGGIRWAIEQATVRRTLTSARKSGFNNVNSTRFDTAGDWHTQDGVLFGEILGNLDTLDELYYTGGEPLINKKFHEMIDYLVGKGIAGRMTLQLNSNITKLTDAIVDKLAHFKHITFTLSLDAANATYEYIRYPAKWATVAENARKLTRLKNAEVCAIPVLQVYNALTMTELFRFCDQLGFQFRVSNCYGPGWLIIHTLPPRALKVAADRFYDYLATECRPENRHVVEAWADGLASGNIQFRADQFPLLNAFTNDLDRSRNQSFEKTFPELVQMYAEAGYPWQSGGRVELLQVGVPQKAA